MKKFHKSRVLEGEFSEFTGLMVAVYFNHVDVVRALFSDECRLLSKQNFQVDEHTLCKNSNCLMLAYLRRSRNSLKYILQQPQLSDLL